MIAVLTRASACKRLDFWMVRARSRVAWIMTWWSRLHQRKYPPKAKIWIFFNKRQISKHLIYRGRTRLDILGPSPPFWMSTQSERTNNLTSKSIMARYPRGALLPCISNQVTLEAILLMDPVSLLLQGFWTTTISRAPFLDPISLIIATICLCLQIMYKNNGTTVRSLRLKIEKVLGAIKTQQLRKMPKWDHHLDTSRLDHIS